MKIADATASRIVELWTAAQPQVQRATYLEHAAQELATIVHERFSESVVIARVFFTVPFEALPSANRAFVQSLADAADVGAGLKPATPVLSLIGTHGEEPDWTDRRKSKGHVGIPLISSGFVGSVPMISRLLKELGVPLEWVDSHESTMIETTMGRTAGLFFVEDAARATDSQGRKIIAAQDFVSRYGVKCVFGIGSVYMGGQIVVLVVFCRDTFARTAAEHFMALAALFTGATPLIVGAAKVFDPQAGVRR